METTNKSKNFRVPNRDIKINLSELLLINTSVFMRLYDIKQLGLAYLVYPFATHSRGFHSLDCLNTAQCFIDHLITNTQNSDLPEENKKELTTLIKNDENLIRISALLHDIMHIPFAHTLEDENGILPKGDKSDRIDKMIEILEEELDKLSTSRELFIQRFYGVQDRILFQESVKNTKQLLKKVKQVLWTIALPDDEIDEKVNEVSIKAKQEGKNSKEIEKIEAEERKRLEKNRLGSENHYIADLIGNTISADLLSYVLSDADATGIEVKPGGWYRLLDYLEISKDKRGRNRMVIRLTKKKGEWRQDVFSAIINILNARYALTEQVIFHHAKCEASAMLGKIASLCDLKESKDLYCLGDEGLMIFLENKAQILLNSPERNIRLKGQGAKHLLDLLRSRRFYKRFHIIPVSTESGYPKPHLAQIYSELTKRIELEEKIEKEFGLDPGSVIIFCPREKMSLKEASALVVYDEIDPKTNEIKELVEPLNSTKSLEFLQTIHPSIAERVKNVELQYRALWKLYLFINPTLIPYCGKGIKKMIIEVLGSDYDDNFDRVYLENFEAFEISELIHDRITKKATGEEVSRVYREVVTSVIQQKEKVPGNLFNWLKSNYESIIDIAIKSVRGELFGK